MPIAFRSNFETHPHTSILLIKQTQLSDSGHFKCRVDYFYQQTTFQLIDLIVILPPQKPKIFLDNQLSVINRLVAKENQSLSLNCESVGGSPQPELTWWKDGREMIDDSFHKYASYTTAARSHKIVPIIRCLCFRLKNKVVNRLVVERLGRSDVDTVISCRALNNNISSPIETTIHIDMSRKHFLYISYFIDIILCFVIVISLMFSAAPHCGDFRQIYHSYCWAKSNTALQSDRIKANADNKMVEGPF